MGADQQFCLRWNNFHTNITSAFESLRDDEDFVDITLACEGKQIKAHKMVLSACSPYFRSLLKGNPCQHPIVFLKDVTFANLTSILDFMYHGEVNVSHNELATFLKTAESLKVRGLAEDEKKKEAEGYNEASSPPPPRDPPDPVSPRGPGEEVNHVPDTHNSDSPPPPKRQRRRSEVSIHSTEDTNETVLSEPRDNSVKNEPQDYIEDDADILIHSDNTQDIKQDIEDNSVERNFGLSESVTISRSQAAMQQLQESFGSFLPGMGQSPGFLPHGATDMPRPPPYSLEGVQGLPPGISALPGPSMSQGAASQDASQDGSRHKPYVCPHCYKRYSSKSNLNTHVRDLHAAVPSIFTCPYCNKTYSSKNSLRYHITMYHRGEKNRDQALQHALATAQPIEPGAIQPGVERSRIQNPQLHSSGGNQIVSQQTRGQHHHVSDQPYTRLQPPLQTSRRDLNVTNQSFPQRNEMNQLNQMNQLEIRAEQTNMVHNSYHTPTDNREASLGISAEPLSIESVDQAEQEIQLVHSQMNVQGSHQSDLGYEHFVEQNLENDLMNHIENASGEL